jgi:3-hydroxybutyrate dehydrogenase
MAERGYGRVINTASVHGLVASVAKAPYVAAKHGIIGITRVTALEYADVGTRESGGVTVNAICPGWVETALIEPQIQARVDKFNGDRAAGIADLLSEKQPSKRMSTPDDIGQVALFLCSMSAHNITGAAIPVDGGWTSQ